MKSKSIVIEFNNDFSVIEVPLMENGKQAIFDSDREARDWIQKNYKDPTNILITTVP